jgi:Calcium binding
MARSPLDKERDERIAMEIIVDAYGPEEQAAGWYIYLTDHLRFPFTAHCVVRRSISPLEVGDEVDVVEMASEEECQHEMFVGIQWKRRPLAVPLAQLEAVQVDEETEQAIQDWRYWVNRGYDL